MVDSAPFLEREAAMAAGVGFIGKNTMLISPGVGSYTVLGVLLVSLEIPPDEPEQARCGSCTLCLDACPTDAIPCDYQIDCKALHFLPHDRTSESDHGLPRRQDGRLGVRLRRVPGGLSLQPTHSRHSSDPARSGLGGRAPHTKP